LVQSTFKVNCFKQCCLALGNCRWYLGFLAAAAAAAAAIFGRVTHLPWIGASIFSSFSTAQLHSAAKFHLFQS
jgi:hypothetical protein